MLGKYLTSCVSPLRFIKNNFIWFTAVETFVLNILPEEHKKSG
jgi:hypothetical protein